MDPWDLAFEIARPLAGLAFPRRASLARVGAGYRSIGRLRRSPDLCVLQLTLEGEGVFRDRGGERRLRPDEAFLCRVSDPQVDYGHPGGERSWTFAFLSFEGALPAVAALVARDGPLRRLPPGHPARERLLALGSRAGRERACARLPAGAAALLVHELLADLADAPASRRPSAAQRLVEDAMARVRRQPGTLPGVEALAADLGVAREHLARCFRRELGEGPREWIAREKIRLALGLLRDERLAIAEVARRCGYPSPGRFAKAFRRLHGCPPRACRAQRRIPLL